MPTAQTDTEALSGFDPTVPLHPSRALVPHAVKLNASLVRRRFWPKIGAVAAHIPFAEDVVALFYAAIDRETPSATKAMLMAALAYFILPFDVIPDWIPGLGYTDDAAVIAAAIGLAGRAIQPRHREAARAQLDRLAGVVRAPARTPGSGPGPGSGA